MRKQKNKRADCAARLFLSFGGVVVDHNALTGQIADFGYLSSIDVDLNQYRAAGQRRYRGDILVVVHKDIV